MFLQKGYAWVYGCAILSCLVLSCLAQPARKPSNKQASKQASKPTSLYSYAYPTKEPLSSPAARLSPHLHARMSHNFCLLGLLDSFIVKSSFCSGFLPRFLPGLLLALDRPAGLRGMGRELVTSGLMLMSLGLRDVPVPPPSPPLRLDRETGGASPFRSMTSSSPWQKVAPPSPWVANIFALRVHVGGRGGVVPVYIYIDSVQL